MIVIVKNSSLKREIIIWIKKITRKGSYTFLNKLNSSHQRCSVEKGVLRNFAKHTGKHLFQSLFFKKVAGGDCNFIKKETLVQVFSCEFCEISKNTFLTKTPPVAASVACSSFLFKDIINLYNCLLENANFWIKTSNE